MTERLIQIDRVNSAEVFPQTQSLALNVENEAGRASLIVGPSALTELGAYCLHAATNAPLGYDEAIPVQGVRHELQPNGWHTVGFRVLGSLEFFLTLDPEGATELRDMLTTAIAATRSGEESSL